MFALLRYFYQYITLVFEIYIATMMILIEIVFVIVIMLLKIDEYTMDKY
jgi:hypothetical protein